MASAKRPGGAGSGAGILGLGSSDGLRATTCLDRRVAPSEVRTGLRVWHLRVVSHCLSCVLVNFLKESLLRFCSWCKGGKGWGKEVARAREAAAAAGGGGCSGGGGLKSKPSRRERDSFAEVASRPKAVAGFVDSWDRAGVSFPRRVGVVKPLELRDLKMGCALSSATPVLESVWS